LFSISIVGSQIEGSQTLDAKDVIPVSKKANAITVHAKNMKVTRLWKHDRNQHAPKVLKRENGMMRQ
jgi:hypothetical protein